MQPIRTSISLHPVDDADLIAKADELQKSKEFSAVVRNALREYLFGESKSDMLKTLEAMSKEVKTLASQMDEVIRLLHSGVRVTNENSQADLDKNGRQGDISALEKLAEMF